MKSPEELEIEEMEESDTEEYQYGEDGMRKALLTEEERKKQCEETGKVYRPRKQEDPLYDETIEKPIDEQTKEFIWPEGHWDKPDRFGVIDEEARDNATGLRRKEAFPGEWDEGQDAPSDEDVTDMEFFDFKLPADEPVAEYK